MKIKSAAIAVAFAATASLAPQFASADHEGCVVVGEFWVGLDTLRTCTYIAQTPSQTVYVGTPYEWRVWVLRSDDAGQPIDLTLAGGIGPPLGALPTVTPRLGDTVYVTMGTGCTPPLCGTTGFLAAGLEQSHP